MKSHHAIYFSSPITCFKTPLKIASRLTPCAQEALVYVGTQQQQNAHKKAFQPQCLIVFSPLSDWTESIILNHLSIAFEYAATFALSHRIILITATDLHTQTIHKQDRIIVVGERKIAYQINEIHINPEKPIVHLIGMDPLYFLKDKWRINHEHIQKIKVLHQEKNNLLPNKKITKLFIYIDVHEEIKNYRTLIQKLKPNALLELWLHQDVLVQSVQTTISSWQTCLINPIQIKTIQDESDFKSICFQLQKTPKAALLSSQPAFLLAINLKIGNQNLYFYDYKKTNKFQHDYFSTQKHTLFLYKGQDKNNLLRQSQDLEITKNFFINRRKQITCKNPLISIVVPVYQRDQEIIRLAKSICAQSYPYLEVIWVLNGSPKKTIESVQTSINHLMQKRILSHVIDLKTAKGSATIPRDVGIFYSRGDFICVMDSDDYLSLDFFDFFKSHTLDLSTIYYPHRIFINQGRSMPKGFKSGVVIGGQNYSSRHLFFALIKRGNFLNNSGVMFSKHSFLQLNGIAHSFKYCEDYEFWLRLAYHSHAAKIHPGCVNIVLHPNNHELSVFDKQAHARAQDFATTGILL